jgi:hypothetical protein
MSATRSNEELWQKVKNEVMEMEVAGTKSGQWSARKAQYAVMLYKKRGGGYIGKKDPKNSLTQWTKQEWTTKSGNKSSETGERYLPKKAIEALSPSQYNATSKLKREGMKRGEQYVSQPLSLIELIKKYRSTS